MDDNFQACRDTRSCGTATRFGAQPSTTTATESESRHASSPAPSDADLRHKRLVTRALRSLEARARQPGVTLRNPRTLADWFRLKLAEYEHEVFAAAWLDNRLRLIAFEELFRGTLDRTEVSTREVVKSALRANAAAVAFAHIHPSGWNQPSGEDVVMTKQLRDALTLVGVRLLDHFIVTVSADPCSSS